MRETSSKSCWRPGPSRAETIDEVRNKNRSRRTAAKEQVEAKTRRDGRSKKKITSSPRGAPGAPAARSRSELSDR